jgi:hypothetical protein
MHRRIAKPDQRQMFRNESRALPRRQAASPQCRRDVALCREPGEQPRFLKIQCHDQHWFDDVATEA